MFHDLVGVLNFSLLSYLVVRFFSNVDAGHGALYPGYI